VRHDFESNTSVAISPTAPVTVSSSIEVPADLGRVRDVNVQLRIRHTWSSDLQIALVAPNGDRVLLVDRAGGSGDDFTNTVFDDSVPIGIEDALPPFAGHFQPHESLSLFDGADAGGSWTLQIADKAALDGGRLEHWKLSIDTDCDCFQSEGPVVIDPGPENTVISTIQVSGHGANVIDSLKVSVNLGHTYTSDLRLTLFGPDGTGVVLFDRSGDDGDDLRQTLFDQTASGLIDEASPPFTGSFRPHESLEAFDGRFADGIWTLQVEDRAAQDGGTLHSWSLDLQTKAAEAPPESNFKIDVVFKGGLTPAQRSVFTLAAARWAEVIVGDLPSGQVHGEVIDDLLIEAKGANIDGVHGTLGMAGPTFVRSDTLLPITGVMTFDSSDLANMEADGSLEDVIIHEMGHVLGLGTMWEDMNLVEGVNTPDWRYTGAKATQEYGALRNQGSTDVPVETDGGEGTAGGHWDEETFRNELMTGFVNGANNPLSRVTAACLEDMGYEVNYAAADGYALPSGFSIRARDARRARPCRVQFTKPSRI
jgi:subtilisin-like proprotein convertase family protein